MKKLITVSVLVGGILLATLALGQMGMGGGMRGMGMMGQPASGAAGASQRHRYVMAHGIDARYATARNPLEASAANIQAGKAIYVQSCAACHGPTGRGDGPASNGMSPPPADLTVTLKMPVASDAFLDWTLSEGGVPVHSAMPPYKAVLKSDQIWQLVLYLKTL